ncbi:MAG: hypothetical protein KAS32_13480 [Candidatus Peribacteraceae bacterium]|nr:hypothetical protein [Candidatus Peribacteraceae bacterium]
MGTDDLKIFCYKVFTGDYRIPLVTIVVTDHVEKVNELGEKAVLDYLLNSSLKDDDSWSIADIREYAESLSEDAVIFKLPTYSETAIVLGDE